MFVHVSGAVRRARVSTSWTKARGSSTRSRPPAGSRPDADEQAVNLARPISDGEQLHVPPSGEAPAPAGPDGGRRRAGQPQHRRCRRSSTPFRASAPRWPQRIIDWRDANGRFTSVEDLLAVPGIGDKMLETLRDLVTV